MSSAFFKVCINFLDRLCEKRSIVIKDLLTNISENPLHL